MRVALITLLASSLLAAAAPAPFDVIVAPRAGVKAGMTNGKAATSTKAAAVTSTKAAAATGATSSKKDSASATGSGTSSKVASTPAPSASGSGVAASASSMVASGSESAVPTFTGKTPKTLSTSFPSSSAPAKSSGAPMPHQTEASCPFEGVDIKQAPKNITEADFKAALKKQHDDKSYVLNGDGASNSTKPASSAKSSTKTPRDKRDHPRATGKIKLLYHGTSMAGADAISRDFPLRIRFSDKAGELTEAGWSGFYMTDSRTEAVAYARWHYPNELTISVVEFSWDPRGLSVKELDNKTPRDREEFEAFQLQNTRLMGQMLNYRSGDYQMISGPHSIAGMHGLHSDSWQYAITSPDGFRGLRVLSIHDFPGCPRQRVYRNAVPYIGAGGWQ